MREGIGALDVLERLNRIFHIKQEGTTLRIELIAGLTSFMTVAYVIAVNAAILNMVGMPFAGVVIATVLSSVFGSLLMAFWANSPLIIVPGMGDNAFFVFTLVLAWGFTWQQALTITLIAGIVFAVVAFLGIANYLSREVPQTLIHAMTAGIGLFIAFIGLKSGGLIVADTETFVKLGNLADPHVLTTLITLLILLPLFLLNIKGNFLIGIIAGTLMGILFGIVDLSSMTSFSFSFSGYREVFAAYDFSGLTQIDFWVALFSLSMMIIFQNMGAQLGILPDKTKFKRSFQALSISVIGSSLFGSSATVSAAESSTGIAAGGRTGLTSLVTGLLFIPAFFIIPLLTIIPMSAIAPIFIIVGALLVRSIKEIPFDDWTEGFPAYLMIAIMPLTFSITNGIAFGFMSYTFIKLVMGRCREISKTMLIISTLFLLYFILGANALV